jgi:hypothetical protein
MSQSDTIPLEDRSIYNLKPALDGRQPHRRGVGDRLM